MHLNSEWGHFKSKYPHSFSSVLWWIKQSIRLSLTLNSPNLSSARPWAPSGRIATQGMHLFPLLLEPILTLQDSTKEEAYTLRLFRIWSLIICDKRCTCLLKYRISLVTLCSLFGNLGTDYGNIPSIEGVKDCDATDKVFSVKIFIMTIKRNFEKPYMDIYVATSS